MIASVVGGQRTGDGIVRSKMVSMLKVNPFRAMSSPLVEPVSMLRPSGDNQAATSGGECRQRK
jgi:hypothetical protein